jgi:hypothetical protein
MDHKSFFFSSFCVEMSDFIYHYLFAGLYVFAISVVIVENDFGNKNHSCVDPIKYFMYTVLSILPPNYLKILPYTLY